MYQPQPFVWGSMLHCPVGCRKTLQFLSVLVLTNYDCLPSSAKSGVAQLVPLNFPVVSLGPQKKAIQIEHRA